MTDAKTRAENLLLARSTDNAIGKVEIVSRMILVFENIAKLDIGKYWLLHESDMDDWRKSIQQWLKDYQFKEDPIKNRTRDRFPDIHKVFRSQFNLERDSHARGLMLPYAGDALELVELAADECGFPRFPRVPSQSRARELDRLWDARRDFEWCVSTSELHDYAGKIDPTQRQMRVECSCYNLMRGHDCDFDTWSSIAESLFLRYEASDDGCSVFSKDTARILNATHDASYVRGSFRSRSALERSEISEEELIDADELAHLEYIACSKMPHLDDTLKDPHLLCTYFLCNKRRNPMLVLLMLGDVVTEFEVSQGAWMNPDMSHVVGVLYANLHADGVYPALVHTRTGASPEARAWIKSRFESCAPFLSFCQCWDLKPRVKHAPPLAATPQCRSKRARGGGQTFPNLYPDEGKRVMFNTPLFEMDEVDEPAPKRQRTLDEGFDDQIGEPDPI